METTYEKHMDIIEEATDIKIYSGKKGDSSLTRTGYSFTVRNMQAIFEVYVLIIEAHKEIYREKGHGFYKPANLWYNPTVNFVISGTSIINEEIHKRGCDLEEFAANALLTLKHKMICQQEAHDENVITQLKL